MYTRALPMVKAETEERWIQIIHGKPKDLLTKLAARLRQWFKPEATPGARKPGQPSATMLRFMSNPHLASHMKVVSKDEAQSPDPSDAPSAE